MNFRYKRAFLEIKHLVTMALLKDNDLLAMDTFKEISEEINAALDGAAGVRALPGCPSLMPAKVIPHDEPAAEVSRNPHPMTYCEIAPGVVLKRFRAGDRVQFVGSNRSTVPDENNQHIYRCEIFKAKAMEDPDYIAECYIDGDSVLQLFCTSRSRLEKVALSAFRKYLYTNRNARDRMRFHRKAEQRGQETAAPVEEPSAVNPVNPVNPVEEPSAEELENA